MPMLFDAVNDKRQDETPSRLRLRRISHINLRVRDVEESVDFYCGLFGLQPREAEPPSESVRLCVAASASQRPRFGLVLCRGLPSTSEPSGLDHFSFEVPAPGDVDAVYRRARRRGAPATKPRYYGGGWQTFVFDPDGYKIEVRATASSAAPKHRSVGRRSLLAVLLAAPLLLLRPAWAPYPALVVAHLSADSPAIVPDTGGPIEQIVVHFDPELEYELTSVYEDLLTELPGGIQIQVLCPSQDAVDTFIRRWGTAASADNRELVVVNVDGIISVWARDRRIARQYRFSNAPASLLVPVDLPDYFEDRRNELALPARLQGIGLVAGVTTIPLVLEGGNVLANTRHAFVGAN
ncbi:MAG: VOC family protein, partial [Planctomycetota bacterium]